MLFAVSLLMLMIPVVALAQTIPTMDGGNMETAAEAFQSLGAGNQNLILSTMGMPTGGLNIWNILAMVLFGAIGFIAFSYGKKMQNFKAMGVGLALMIYPYFVTNTFWNFVVGSILTAGLYFCRD